jgi:hypothetical protein
VRDVRRYCHRHVGQFDEPLATAVLTGAEAVADAVPLPLLLLSEQAISSMLQPITPTPTARTRFTSIPFAHVRRLVAPSRASTGRAVGYRSQQTGVAREWVTVSSRCSMGVRDLVIGSGIER